MTGKRQPQPRSHAREISLRPSSLLNRREPSIYVAEQPGKLVQHAAQIIHWSLPPVRNSSLLLVGRGGLPANG